ncbi:transcription termination/antitermination NusG family protein [Providencia vermicola]|uniref:transcription termination/antitermination NusG family protein n=1 Tax=Providencia vermicola TaxID=333965 RepID=UPI0032DAB494
MKSKEWYLLYCKSQDAEKIKRRVSQLNVKPFYPQYVKITTRKDCKSVRKEEKPLFPNYLFLSFDITKTHTSDITSIPGAVGFVRFCNKPCLVPDNVVSAIECARMLAIDDESIEYRNVSPELLEKIQEITQISSTTTRQVLFSKLLETNTL